VSLGTRSSRNPGLPPAARGAALIGLLVVIGIIGLQVLDDSSPSGSDVTITTLPGQTTLPGTATTVAPGTTATTKAATATTKAGATATTRASTATTAKLKKNADVKVFVYNASGVQGMAANMSDKLKSVGYNVTGTGNITPIRTGTTVSCRAGLDAEATKLANDGVGSGATVAAFPTNPPQGSGADDCIVILGKTA
jgi:LytR cell envelope-related transcriptional attenuator